MINSDPRMAIFSLWNDDKTPAAARLAASLNGAGFTCIASGGTRNFLEAEAGIKVTDTAEITGLDAALDHRVNTLTPQLHGGLLAEIKHLEELARRGWPWIDAACVTFYPLQRKMQDLSLSDADINNAVDIGGPTMVSSACKGGRIVVTDPQDYEWVTDRIIRGVINDQDVLWLQAIAAAWVAEYRAAEARFRSRRLRPQ
jgi:phosphoribosylaminoimidazolecarboxamide formyltransferase / IMP cyclohydrolase